MADTDYSDVEAEDFGISESDRLETESTREIRSRLKARSGQNTRGDVPIKKLPDFARSPKELYTSRHWQFGLHNRSLWAISSESEVLKISLAAACNLNPDEWDKFCDYVVGNPADMMLKSYGMCSCVTNLILKEVKYLLALDALTLVLVLSSFSRVPNLIPDQADGFWLLNLFIGSLDAGGFNIEALLKDGLAYWTIWDDLFLCENQIPMALMKKAISKCYGLLPEERKSNFFPHLRELDNPDSNVTKKLLDTILKYVAFVTCLKIFPEPCPDKKYHLFELIDVSYAVGELENCAHVFACIHKVMTTCVEKSSAVGTPPIPVTTTFGRAKQLFLRAVATGSKELASVIATIFRFSRETATGGTFGRVTLQSATVLKKAGLQIKGIPGMVQQVAFKNGCLHLPIILHTGSLQSYMCNMAAYESLNTSAPFPFTNYVLLMSHLIKIPEDVSYLVDCGVIRTDCGTQQRILQTWESLLVVYPPYSNLFRVDIVEPINRHCASALNKMRTEFYYTFCSKPWLPISVISAIILLVVATLIQTYVLVIGSDKMQPHFPRGG
ncbi:unnamed protein product [Sphagnum jensenii]|uniref:Uncharacterized protein n=1 Tax=Sphagnum jensenii TaxID=128206 RepID=A0ABP1C035_9BRYO